MISLESLRLSQPTYTNADQIRPDGMKHSFERPSSEMKKTLDGTQQAQEKDREKQDSVQEVIKTLQNDMEIMHNVGLKFSVHEGTGRIMIRVIDRDTEKLIREIPPEHVLDLAEKMQEMIGILFDEKA